MRQMKADARTGPDEGTGATAAASGLVLVRRQRLGDQLYGQILEQIMSGRLREGARLPSEKELCERFGVSRPVVRQALMRLRGDGLLHVRQGAGTYVTACPADRLTSFASPEDLAGLLRGLEARLPLEAAACRWAAERRTPAQLAVVEAAHATFARDIEAGQASAEADLAFHAGIAAAAGNEFFSSLLESLHGALVGFMRLSLSLTRTGSRQRASAVLDEHARILDAIRAQEPETAQIAMQFHIVQARRRMVDRKQTP